MLGGAEPSPWERVRPEQEDSLGSTYWFLVPTLWIDDVSRALWKVLASGSWILSTLSPLSQRTPLKPHFAG